MDVLLEPLEGAQRKFRVVFSDEEVRSRVEKEIRSVIKDLKIPGYRVGRVPVSYLRSRPGSLGSIYDAVSEALRQDSINALVKEDSGTVVFLDPEPFTVTGDHETSGITVQGILEIFALPENFVYEGVSLSPEEVPTVSPEEIAREIEALAKRVGTQFRKDLPEDASIEEGDLVSFTFSFVHPDTGGAVEGRQTVTPGDPQLPGALTRSLIGRKVGDIFSETLPFNIPTGKKNEKPRIEAMEASITISGLRRVEPAIPEELLEVLSPAQGKEGVSGKEPGQKAAVSLESLVATRILERKVSEVLTRKMDELASEILARNPLAVPEKRIQLEIDRLSSSGTVRSDSDREKVRKETLWWFILDGLAAKMSLQPGMKRVEEEYLSLVRQGGSPDKDEKRRREYIEHAFLSARRRMAEEFALRKSTFAGWDEFFGEGGVLVNLGWDSFGLPQAEKAHSHGEHDHSGHDHSDQAH